MLSVFRWWSRVGVMVLTVAVLGQQSVPLRARQSVVDLSMFREMAWRSIGPFRGGRTTVAMGVASQPHTFFAGTAHGGLWKTTDAGRTWRPIFDRQPTGAIGSMAIARSNPSVMYVGTGEAATSLGASRGLGLFRSNDGGGSWIEMGLADHRHLSAVIVDPSNPDRLFVASTGSAFGPGRERGVYRSTNGGHSFEQVYFKDQDTGALDLAFDPVDASIVYATVFQSRRGAEPGDAAAGPGTGLVKSTDGGTSWRAAEEGLPTFRDHGLRRIRLAVSASNRSRLFAAVAATTRGGVYRSDDAGASWSLAHGASATVDTNDESVTVAVDPTNADVVYVTGRTTVRSSDAGRTFTTWHAEPSGGAFRSLWINRVTPTTVMLSGDRGGVITLNGGDTWSSSFNQPTGQFADVVTDTAFPYRVCGAERDSAPGCLPSRGARGRIGLSDWQSVSSVAGRAVAPDPQDPDAVFSGSVSRFDRRTGQLQDVRPKPSANEPPGPLAYSADGRNLYYGGDAVWRGAAGSAWSVISPQFSPDDAAGSGISSLSPSTIENRLLWVGTDDGTIQVTRDAGLTWTRVTPSGFGPWWRISSVEPSHFDTNTAYASAIATRLDDDRPHIVRTRDGGASWQPITTGLPNRATVNAIREDSLRRGLLFASTDQSVFVSFDDGERWQSLRLNLPPVPITDLTVKDADLVVSTNGRGFWVLDDISPFRQVTSDLSRAGVFLFRPATAWRTHPMRPVDPAAHRDEPAGYNPPDGIAINYLVGSTASAEPVTVEIIETLTGDLIQRYTAEPTPGVHRVIWDLKYTPISGQSLWVMPGTYQVRLTSGAQIARQAVIVRMDPRIRTSTADLTAQFKTSRTLYERRRRLTTAMERLQDTPLERERRILLSRIAADVDRALSLLQQADVRPTPAAEAAATAAIASADAALATE